MIVTRRADRRSAGFRIRRIVVRNVGVLDALTLDFDVESVTALYAGNGLGKTTVLECLSLVGHLPCFPTFSREGDFQRSLLETVFPFQGCDNFEHYSGVFDSKRARTIGTLSYLDEEAPGQGASFGFVQFEIEDVVGDAVNINRFAIIVHSPLIQSLATPRLTDILSRDSLVTAEFANMPASADDRILGRCGLIVYDPERQTGRSVHELVRAVAKGRTFHIEDGQTPVVRRLTLHDMAAVEPRSVCYVNTDLNDFGRGNDLRESPKDLERDFAEQMLDRLELEIGKTGRFEHFDQLKRSCDAVLSTPLEHFSHRRVVPPAFDLQSLTVHAGSVGIWIDRLDGQEPVPINFLSAGENEVLFIYLMLLNFTRNPLKGASIVLLDEPDLHIANSSRLRFFEEVLQLTDGRAQLIMSTHSPAAYEVMKAKYTKPEAKTKILMRVLPDDDEISNITHLVAKFDAVYIGRLRRLNYSRGLRANVDHFVGFTAARVVAAFSFSSTVAYATTVGWLIAFLLCALLTIGAISNDVLNNDATHWAWRKLLFFGMSPTRYHDETRRIWFGVIPSVLAPPLAFICRWWYVRRRHQQRLDRFRAHARRTGS